MPDSKRFIGRQSVPVMPMTMQSCDGPPSTITWVLRSDLDFGSILAVTRNRRPSVIQLRADVPTPGVMGQVILSSITAVHEHLAAGALVSIDFGRARLRLLPLGD